MRAELIEKFREDTTAAWVERLNAAGVPSAPVATLPDVMSDPQLDHRGLSARLPAHEELPVEEVSSITTGYITNADGPVAEQTAPTLGEHTDEYLTQLGLGGADIARLRAEKIVA